MGTNRQTQGRKGDQKQKALTPRQVRFVEAYLLSPVATEAARAAGFKHPEQQGYQLTHLPRYAHVQAAISRAQEARAQRVQVEQDVVLRELLRIATVDIGQAFQEDGRLKPLHEMPEDVRRAIAGVEVTELGSEDTGIGILRKVKFWDKPKTLELLGKHLKLFTEKHEVGGADGTPLSFTINLGAA